MKIIHNIHSHQNKILIVEDQFIEAYDLQLILNGAGYMVCGMAKSVDEALLLIEKEKPDLVLLDIFLKGRRTGIDLAKELQKKNIGFIFISANSGQAILDEAKTTQPYGFIVKPFRELDVITALEIALYRLRYSVESRLMYQRALRSKINAIPLQQSRETALKLLGSALQSYIPFDYLEAGFCELSSYQQLGLLRRQYEDYQIITLEQLSKIAEITVEDIETMYRNSPSEKHAGITLGEDLLKASRGSSIKRLVINSFRLKSYLAFPFMVDGQSFSFCLYSRQADSFESNHLTLLADLEETVSDFIRKQFSKAAITSEKNVPNKVTISPGLRDFEGMIGSSPKMITVFDYIKKVAPLDISVLISGDHGTGKERVARGIHNLSKRKGKAFVPVNCGAIPEHLVESILFGHEKGAFSGAIENHTGKFELAEGGTIFLDEVGEMPMEIQVKLLRVLQEKEIDRVGGKLPVKIDVRVIAATNKNLEAEVAAGRFRIDLYYRLHVFPITVPALRDRKDDIPALVAFFCNSCSEGIGKKDMQFSKESIFQMVNYNWPGNIRELEHFVQRTLLLSEENIIRNVELPLTKPENTATDNSQLPVRTIEENEREHILFVLQKCNWKISGIGGAAEMLGLPSSTLNAKMRKLNIRKTQKG